MSVDTPFDKFTKDGKFKPSTRVIVPGCQGGISQIHFGDDQPENKDLQEKKTKVNVHGKSQIKFGNEDETEVQEQPNIVPEENKPVANNTNNIHYKPTTRVTQPSGGSSSITFG